jgi:hypothetical protein
LRLVTGDQSIKSLAGSGVLALGSNGLTIDTGGDFAGEVTGTGRLSVRTGDFTVRGVLTSSDPKSEFVIGGGANQSTSSRLVLPTSASLKFPTVSISGQGATASIGGRVDASNAINVTSTGTNLATVANLHLVGGSVTSPVVNVAGGNIDASVKPGISLMENMGQILFGQFVRDVSFIAGLRIARGIFVEQKESALEG